jgi:hypothetical protein
MEMHVDIGTLAMLGDAWKRAPDMVIEELTAATYKAEMLLERETKELTPVGVNAALRDNIYSQVPEVLGDTVIGMMGSTLNYAEAVELGTQPHAVSEAGVLAIEDWVRHKLGIAAEEAQRVAEAVAWKIRMRGTPAVGMFHRALAWNKQQLEQIYAAAAGRIAQRLGEV